MTRSSLVHAAAVAAVVLTMSCLRIADAVEEPIDFEALRIEACTSACDTFDTCDPDRFVGMEPEDCFERCMTGLPALHEENQCGSREMIYVFCIGELDCEGLAAFEAGNDLPNPRDYEAPCVMEISRAAYNCDPDAPFDLDEPIPEHP